MKYRFKIDLKKNRKIVILWVIIAVLLLSYGALGLLADYFIHRMPDQLAADRWDGDMKMAQTSIFITEDQIVSEKDIPKIRYNLEKKLEEAGVVPPEEDDADQKNKQPRIIDTIGIDEMNSQSVEQQDDIDRRIVPETGIKKLYRLAYSAEGTVDVTWDERTVESASAVGVGGSFFLFHPLELVTGSYLMDDALMKDGIIVDEDVAWQLFGSVDIIDQPVLIGDVPHYIKGVVKKPKGKIEELSGLDKNYVFLSYDSLSKYGEILSGKTSEGGDDAEEGPMGVAGGINCIEIVAPNPVNGLVASVAKDITGQSEEHIKIVDNTARFNFFSLIEVIRNTGLRSMWSKAIYYPYWENVARGYEERLAFILEIRIFCIVAVLLIAVNMIIGAYRRKTWTIESVAMYLADKKYDLEVKRHQKKNNSLTELASSDDESDGEEGL
jgi:hypothetical protein